MTTGASCDVAAPGIQNPDMGDTYVRSKVNFLLRSERHTERRFHRLPFRGV